VGHGQPISSGILMLCFLGMYYRHAGFRKKLIAPSKPMRTQEN
jgi:hypothetical protein